MNEWIDIERTREREREREEEKEDYDKLSNSFVLSFSFAQE